MSGKNKIDNQFVKSIDQEVQEVNKDPLTRRKIMKWEWKLREARDSGIEQEKEDAIVSSLKEKLPIQLIAKIARTTVKKVKETAKKHNLENFIVNN